MNCHECGGAVAKGQGKAGYCVGNNEISLVVLHKECNLTSFCGSWQLPSRDLPIAGGDLNADMVESSCARISEWSPVVDVTKSLDLPAGWKATMRIQPKPAEREDLTVVLMRLAGKLEEMPQE